MSSADPRSSRKGRVLVVLLAVHGALAICTVVWTQLRLAEIAADPPHQMMAGLGEALLGGVALLSLFPAALLSLGLSLYRSAFGPAVRRWLMGVGYFDLAAFLTCVLL